MIPRDRTVAAVTGAADPPGLGEPAWDGRTGSLGYLAKMFPRISETFVLKEILALRAAGLPVRIYSLLPPARDARLHPEAAALLPEVQVLPAPSLANLGRFGADLWFCFRARPGAVLIEVLRALVRPGRASGRRLRRAATLAAWLRRDRVAHLHAAWAHTPAGVARVAARMAGLPWSMSAHAKDIHLSRRTSLAKKLAAARYTLACTQAHRDLLAEIGRTAGPGPNSPDVHLLYHGVDVKHFSPCPAPAEGAPIILSVGRLVPKKGFDLLLQAAARLKARGVPYRLEIVGEGPLRPHLERQVSALGLDDRVTLLGMLVRSEVRDAYARASCFALASRVTPQGDRDGIPNTLAEAMASGLAVVAARQPGIEELVVDDEAGILVPPEDPAALADALEPMLRDPALRARLGARARARVADRFDAAAWEARVVERLRRSLGIEKVLYVSADRGVPARGSKGASVHVRAIVSALMDWGVAVSVITTRPGPADGPAVAAPLQVCGTTGAGAAWLRRLARLPGGGPALERAWIRLADNVSLYRNAQRLARAWHADAIYERYALTAVAGSLVARRLRIPHILEVNAPLAEEEARYRGLRLGWLARGLEGWLLRRADRVIVVSRELAAYASARGVAGERIVVLPNAADPRVFHPGRDGSAVRRRYDLNGAFVLGFSGTLKPWHGLGHLVGALGQLRDTVPQAHLLVVGAGPGAVAAQAQAQQLGIEQQVHLAGSVPHAEVPDFLAACDVLVAPYGPLEDFWFSPLKVAEYRAMGRPVVASAIGQLRELAGEEAGVVFVPPGDEEALARALAELAADPERRARLSRAATAHGVCTWRDHARRILSEAERARREIWGWAP